MLVRPILVLAALAAATLSTGADAAAPKPEVIDVVGDANAINNQGVTAIPDQSVSTGPAQAAPFDITSIDFKTYGAKVGRKFVAQGYTVTMALSAAPVTTGALYRVRAIAPACSTFWLQWNTAPTGTTTTLRHNCAPSGSPTAAVSDTVSVALKPVVVKGSTITWTVPFKSLPKGVKVGQTLTELGADNRISNGAATAPQIDGVFTTAKYKIGS